MELGVELVRKQDVLDLCGFYMNHYYSLSREGIIEQFRKDVFNLAVAQKICNRCGWISFTEDRFCPKCGLFLGEEKGSEDLESITREKLRSMSAAEINQEWDTISKALKEGKIYKE